ncbi:MAG: nitroreductase family protein [Porphyromonas sp.]|nr:nitroreductase family protein [Porphyromonas sp.]
MSFRELAEQRQSDRRYDESRPVPREVIDRILDTARLAPSATNSQPWRIVVVDEPQLRDQVAATLTSPLVGSMNKFAVGVPVLLVLVEEPGNIAGKAGNLLLNKHLPAYDLGILSAYITLAAREEGLGSCIMGWVNQKQLRKVLGLPKHKNVPLVISLGYSLQPTRSKKRKSLEEIRSFNSYKE